MNKPEVWPLENLSAFSFGKAAVWTLDLLREKVTGRFPLDPIAENATPPIGLDTLLVVGGGELMDRAKYWRATQGPNTKLIIIPSIWGSGAENSRIAILNDEGKKSIFIGSEYLPDVRSVWPELVETIPEQFVAYACGDVWAHALEGFLSPVGSDETRAELTDVIKGISNLPVGKNAAWFEFGARACAGQAASSVGLVHGIAHTLEGPFRSKYPNQNMGHAKLCSIFLWPVFSLNMKHSNKIHEQFKIAGIDEQLVINILKSFYDAEIYHKILPSLEEHWRLILREPSSRTNSVLVRPSYIEYFKTADFS